MAVKYEDIVSQIKKRQFAPVYILMGEEPFYIDRLSKMLEESILAPEERDFNQVVLYGKDTDVDTVIANVKQFPFGSPFRVVILKEAKDLKKIDLLSAYLQNPSPQTILVICHKYGKMKTQKVAKSCVVFESTGVADWNLKGWIQNLAKDTFGFRMSQPALEMFSEHIGNDLSRIYTEFQKLQIILPQDSEITPDIIEKYIGISKEYNIFELQNALGAKDTSKAYKIALNFAMHQKENPNIRTIAMLFSFYNKMLMYHLSPDKSNAALKEIYGSNPNILARNIGIARGFTVPQLIRIISILREYDLKAKGVDADFDSGEQLKEMIVKITH